VLTYFFTTHFLQRNRLYEPQKFIAPLVRFLCSKIYTKGHIQGASHRFLCNKTYPNGAFEGRSPDIFVKKSHLRCSHIFTTRFLQRNRLYDPQQFIAPLVRFLCSKIYTKGHIQGASHRFLCNKTYLNGSFEVQRTDFFVE